MIKSLGVNTGGIKEAKGTWLDGMTSLIRKLIEYKFVGLDNGTND